MFFKTLFIGFILHFMIYTIRQNYYEKSHAHCLILSIDIKHNGDLHDFKEYFTRIIESKVRYSNYTKEIEYEYLQLDNQIKQVRENPNICDEIAKNNLYPGLFSYEHVYVLMLFMYLG